MPTIDDVSKLARVSKATVSRVLTGTRGVREASREAVLRAVEELNYRPSFAAQNLASQSSSYIGIVIPASDALASASLLPLLSRAIKNLNKSLLVEYPTNSDETQDAIHSLSHQCAAVILCGQYSAPLPGNAIVFDTLASADKQSPAGYDYAFATESACRYLFGKGHRHIAVLIDNEQDAASQQMIDGYRSVLQNYSLPFNRQLLVSAGENVEQALLTLINSFTRYSAIIVKRDLYGAEAMRLLREFNIAVPNEVSLLSLEGSPLAGLLNPPLTCFALPVELLLEHCIQQIRRFIDGQPAMSQESRPLTGRLISRLSVADIA